MNGREEAKGQEVQGNPIPRSRESLARIASALEVLASDPEVEVQVGPPVCPHCGEFNPRVMLPASEAAEGPMAEIIIDPVCTKCSQPFYIVIDSFSVHPNRETVREEIESKKRAGVWKHE